MQEDVKLYLSSDINDRYTKYLIMQGGKTLAFNFNGDYKSEVKTFSFATLQEVDILSIVHYEGGYELATHVGRQFKKLKPKVSLNDLYNYLIKHPGLATLCNRGGIKDGCKFRQYFFVYYQNNINIRMLEEI